MDSKLRNIRLRKNMTLSQFASVLGCSASTLSSWENGMRSISSTGAKSLSRYMNWDQASTLSFLGDMRQYAKLYK